MEQVLKALYCLKSDNSILAKKEILKDYDSVELRRILQLTYDPFIKFYIRGDNATLVNKIDNKRNFNEDIDSTKLFNVLGKLNRREITGHSAIEAVFQVIQNVSQEECELVQNILNKDLRCGISSKTVNSIYPKLCKEYDVMLCDSLNIAKTKLPDMKKINALKYPIRVDIKQDGVRGTYNFEPGKFTTRNGHVIEGYEHLEKLLKEMNKDNPDRILEGELKGGTLQETMGELNRIKGQDTSKFVFNIWDKLEYVQDQTNCYQRTKDLEKLIKDFSNSLIQFCPFKWINSPKELIEYLHEVTAQGEEGLVVKLDKPYEFRRSKNWLKLKLFLSDDCPIIDCEEGKGRNVGKLGAFVIDFNGVTVNVGSGYSDEQREEYWTNKDSLIGNIIEVSYKQVTPDGSMQFPTFVKLRTDLDK